MFFKPKDNILFKSCNVVNSTCEAPHARETALSIVMHSAHRGSGLETNIPVGAHVKTLRTCW